MVSCWLSGTRDSGLGGGVPEANLDSMEAKSKHKPDELLMEAFGCNANDYLITEVSFAEEKRSCKLPY